MCGCDCWSLPYGIIKKVKGFETLTHTFKNRIGDKTNQNKKNRRIEGPNQRE